MNDFTIGNKRVRSQTVLIVEGKHERNELFRLIFRCFPEIHINMENVWIYGTNIYMLYEDIVKEYGTEWTEVDVDLPFIVSKKKKLDTLRYKKDFINILLIFDYERHDPNFSEEKILEMQNYFTDSTDSGKLYINYPMIESYQHLKSLPDEAYAERTIPVTLRPGVKYKSMVKKETAIVQYINFPRKVEELLKEHFNVHEEKLWKSCYERILGLSEKENIESQIQTILNGALEQQQIQTAKYQFINLVLKVGYVQERKSFWEYVRTIFQQVIFHNICKANKIQNGEYRIEGEEYRKCFDELSFAEILKKQNKCSRDMKNGFIWVLNTCVFIVADYNFTLLLE